MKRKIFQIANKLSGIHPFLRGLFLFRKKNKRLPALRVKTFNDVLFQRKIKLWFKDLRIYVDKVAVREEVAKRIGNEHVIKLYKTFSCSEDINEGQLVFPCVVKSNHASDQVAIIHSWSEFCKRRDEFNSWLKEDYYKVSGEPCYKGVKPCLFAEEALLNDGAPPVDYKFHCFGGKVQSIQLDLDRFTNHTRIHYSTDWQKQNFSTQYPLYPGDVTQPESLTKMIAIAEKLAANFRYVRVDLYDYREQIYFGEYTFFHGNAGEQNSDAEWDSWLVKQFMDTKEIQGLI
jgi:hypothetical protein